MSFEERWTRFRAMLGDRLSPERVERYVRLLCAMPRLFDRYRSRRHLTIVHGGVRDYGFDALLDDYRLSALWQLSIPVWQATAKLPAVIWWSHLERAMFAFDDLRCAELLE